MDDNLTYRQPRRSTDDALDTSRIFEGRGSLQEVPLDIRERRPLSLGIIAGTAAAISMSLLAGMLARDLIPADRPPAGADVAHLVPLTATLVPAEHPTASAAPAAHPSLPPATVSPADLPSCTTALSGPCNLPLSMIAKAQVINPLDVKTAFSHARPALAVQYGDPSYGRIYFALPDAPDILRYVTPDDFGSKAAMLAFFLDRDVRVLHEKPLDDHP